ncbi:MAG: aspartate aminotransferase family protein [Phycisphaerae bacterium]|jgi:4-aminobutyrate aminotransferase/4-aminobutyrate aminotransferase/(S)-3-amino-2-methylpropionate transaminase
MSDAAGATVEELLRLKSRYLVPCVYHFYRQPPHLVRGRGCHLFDVAGRRYLDCYGGVTVMNAGHCNPEIIEPAIAQVRRLQHTTGIYLTEPVLRLAEALARIAPGGLCRSFFTASGSEAVEGALLLAGLHTRRPEVVAATGGLHGRTRWAMNVTGLDLWRTDPFPLPGVHHVPFGDADALAGLLDRRADQIAAFIAEPVQGNGGIRIPPPDYWPAVRRLCDQYGVLLVMDEVQTGFGRTGRWFAGQHWNVAPDVLVLSKALGNGFPIAAFMTTDDIAASYTRPGASTYGGNPVSAAAALAVIEYHRRHRLAERSRELGVHLLEGLTLLAGRSARLADPRGLGLMAAVDVVDEKGAPDPAGLDRLLEDLKDRGYLCGKTGAGRNALTFMPPLVIERTDLDGLLEALSEAVVSLEMKS